MSELLPRPVRLMLGATSRGVGERRLHDAVAGKVVLVTGASSGVGRATALKLAAAGATVLLVARRAELLEEHQREIVAGGGSAFAYPCDLGDIEQVEALAASVLERHHNVDVIVSNAGISIRRWISDSYERFDDVERTIKVNYLGPVRLMLGLLPSMRARGGGQIVNVATLGVNFPPLRWSAYIASKAALETWLAGAAPEIAADGVATTSIHLQLVRSPMLGPFRMWNYLPGMSTEEAASIVARAIVERPRTISPAWARLAGSASRLAQRPLELALAQYVRAVRGEPPAPVGTLQTIASSRAIRPVRPDRLLRALGAQRRFGVTPAFAAAAATALYADRPALIDECGTLSFGELDSQARALAGAIHSRFQLGCGDRVAIMCRNHRGFIQTAVAATRLGCDLVPLNTEFASPQLADVLAREEVSAVVYDEEFEPVLEDSGFAGVRIVAGHEEDLPHPALESLIDEEAEEAPLPRSPGQVIMLTSGTTGTPKGAVRTFKARSLAPLAVAALFDLPRISQAPRSGQAFVVAPPLFHLYGLVGTMVAFGLGSPAVIRRRFDAQATLEQIERHRAGVLLAIPTMLRRIMDLPPEIRDRYDTSSLRMVLSGAAPLAGELALAVMDRFGDVLYNGYASTEVGSGTLATPADLRAAPGTVGRPASGTTVKILDPDGGELAAGATGRIFIGSPLLFDGYTGGGSKEMIDGLMSTGDLGHFDEEGRLFIDGRDDDMILSGGENVFPQEVEELLGAHDAVADVAVFGIADEDFGQRLAARVVRKDGARVSAEELKGYVRERLARHKVPREIEFAESLPRTSTGKLQRRKLAAR